MIRFLSDPAELLPIIDNAPTIGALIMSRAVAFVGDSAPADIWLSVDKDITSGAIAVFGKDIYVLAINDKAKEEISDILPIFISGGARNIHSGEDISNFIKEEEFSVSSFPVLCCDDRVKESYSSFILTPPEKIKDLMDFYYGVLGEDALPKAEEWELYLSRGIRRRQITSFMLYEGNAPVGAAMINGRTEKAGLITDVCTHPDYRGRGCATKLVSTLINTLIDEERKAYIVPQSEKAAALYESIGFAPFSTEYLYTRKENK